MKLITPKVWGEDAWRFMHVVALGFPAQPTERDRSDYEGFYRSLTRVLPCAHCRKGYADIFERFPINTDDTESLFLWTVDVHNAVNRKLGHDVMDPKWVRNVYVFRDHEKDQACEPGPAHGVAFAAFLAVGLLAAFAVLSKRRFVK